MQQVFNTGKEYYDDFGKYTEIDKLRVSVKLWIKKEEIEESALEQIYNAANLPFAFHHIAIMPDCHKGYGLPVGGIMATEGVVVPYAIGVDIGCFTGDTRVPLLNGTKSTLKDLAKRKEPFYVYSIDKDFNIVPGKAICKKTRKNAQLIELMISGGEIVKCTPDHKFMLLDGTYKEAQYLKPLDSLMPLYRSYESKDGYEHIRSTLGQSGPTHKIVSKFFLGEKPKDCVVHHKNTLWYDNSPENLEYKDYRLHSSEHRKLKPMFGTKEFQVKRLKKLQRDGFT